MFKASKQDTGGVELVDGSQSAQAEHTGGGFETAQVSTMNDTQNGGRSPVVRHSVQKSAAVGLVALVSLQDTNRSEIDVGNVLPQSFNADANGATAFSHKQTGFDLVHSTNSSSRCPIKAVLHCSLPPQVLLKRASSSAMDLWKFFCSRLMHEQRNTR